MVSKKKSIPVRIEEVPVLGKFLKDSFVRDYADFADYSPDFNNAYKNNFFSKLTGVEKIVNPIKLISELKKITARLYENTRLLRSLLNKLEGYVNRAGDALTIFPEDFGIKPVREKISSKDVEGLLENLKVVLENISDNLSVIQNKGYKTAAHNALIGLRNSIKADNAAQNKKMDAWEQKVRANSKQILEFWKILKDVMETGRVRLYKDSNKEKAGDYTLSTLKKRIRHERKRTGDDKLPALKM